MSREAVKIILARPQASTALQLRYSTFWDVALLDHCR